MIRAVELSPDAVYDDGSLLLELGITATSIARARRQGTLRYCKVGNRTLYLGRWVLHWLETASTEDGRSGNA